MEIRTSEEIIKPWLKQGKRFYNYDMNDKWVKISDVNNALKDFEDWL